MLTFKPFKRPGAWQLTDWVTLQVAADHGPQRLTKLHVQRTQRRRVRALRRTEDGQPQQRCRIARASRKRAGH
jgi:hypothetical protein